MFQVLGRLASQISTVVQGKDKPTYAPNRDDGDMCIVINAKDIAVTGRKMTDKVYYWHTGQVSLPLSFFDLVVLISTTEQCYAVLAELNLLYYFTENKGFSGMLDILRRGP